LTDYQALTRPTTAFITFEEENAVDIALHSKDKIFIFSDEPLQVKKASEPTDIIWENRYLKGSALLKREIIAYGAVLLILLAGFIFMFFLVVKEIQVSSVFPPVDCT